MWCVLRVKTTWEVHCNALTAKGNTVRLAPSNQQDKTAKVVVTKNATRHLQYHLSVFLAWYSTCLINWSSHAMTARQMLNLYLMASITRISSLIISVTSAPRVYLIKKPSTNTITPNVSSTRLTVSFANLSSSGRIISVTIARLITIYEDSSSLFTVFVLSFKFIAPVFSSQSSWMSATFGAAHALSFWQNCQLWCLSSSLFACGSMLYRFSLTHIIST